MSTVVAGAVDIGATGGPSAAVDDAAPAAQEQPDGGFAESTNLTDAESTFRGGGVNDTAGQSVANAGDVNGDGVDDLIIGAPRNSSAGPNTGAAYIVYGPAEPGEVNLTDADVVLRGATNNELAGWSVSSAGDLNGDGIDEVVVGAPGNDTAAPNGGAAFVVYGDESLPAEMNLSAEDADAVLAGTEAYGQAGYSVSAVNRTGPTDGVAVGAPYANTTGTNAGAAYVVDGDTLGESDGAVVNLSDADAAYFGERNGSNAGWSVADAGDVDDDGVADVAIGAPGYNATVDAAGDAETEQLNRTGMAYVVNGSADGTVSLDEATAAFRGVSEGDRAGWSVAGAGDVNNDSTADLIVGAPYNDSNNRTNAGAAYVVYGDSAFSDENAADVTLADADVRMAGTGALDRTGWSVASYGANGTGCDAASDVLVGAPFNDTAGENAGAVYVVDGGDALDGDVNLTDADATFLGAGEDDWAGYAVADAGDLYDDGTAAVAIGAPYNDSLNRTDAGAAYALQADCPETVGVETEAPGTTETAADTATETETATDTVTETDTGIETDTVTDTETATETVTATETATDTATETDTETTTDTATETDAVTDTEAPTETTETAAPPAAEPEESINFVSFCFDSDQTDRKVIIINSVTDDEGGDPITVNYREGGPGLGPESVIHQTGSGLYEQSGSPGVVEAGSGSDVSGDRSASSPCAGDQTELRFSQGELDRGSIKAYPDDTDAGEGAETETPDDDDDNGDDEGDDGDDGDNGDDGGAGNAPAGDQTALETLSTSPLFPAPFVGLMALSLAVLATARTRES